LHPYDGIQEALWEILGGVDILGVRLSIPRTPREGALTAPASTRHDRTRTQMSPQRYAIGMSNVLRLLEWNSPVLGLKGKEMEVMPSLWSPCPKIQKEGDHGRR
jgi:hypothetical protein